LARAYIIVFDLMPRLSSIRKLDPADLVDIVSLATSLEATDSKATLVVLDQRRDSFPTTPLPLLLGWFAEWMNRRHPVVIE
jgi:hypothetical protein